MNGNSNVRVDKVTVESHMKTQELLEKLIEGTTLELSFIADQGTGATVNLKLHPTHFEEDLKSIFLSDPIQQRMRDIGLEITRIE